MSPTLDDLRRYAVARSLFAPTTLPKALDLLGFVQADPIRAPARAQDLTLRHRVSGYVAGDLERLYSTLSLEEDTFINYGFLTRAVWTLMHPRARIAEWTRARDTKARAVLELVRARGTVHPREVDAFFAHGRVTNYWGGSSSATTHLLELMHYRGLLRVAGRQGGIRLYAAHEHAPAPLDAARRRARVDGLVDVLVQKYAPLPGPSLSGLVHRLRHAVPQWQGELKDAVRRAKERLAHARVRDADWYWPAGESPASAASQDAVRLLAPFDPVVWDRRRFEMLWDWAYRFEAYTPARKRTRGYYALPLVWRDRVVGWGNAAVKDGALDVDLGYVAARPPRDRAFTRELDAELERLRVFLGLAP